MAQASAYRLVTFIRRAPKTKAVYALRRRTCRVQFIRGWRIFLPALLPACLLIQPALAQDKPTGAPLVLSSTETEQEVPLAILLPTARPPSASRSSLHWNPSPPSARTKTPPASRSISPRQSRRADVPGAALERLARQRLAWQEPWEGARWKILQTPVSDGTGIDAALAVG